MKRFYFLFFGSLCMSSIAFLVARRYSWSAVLFLVVNIGNAHYLMAYLANIQRWRSWSWPIMRAHLLVWLGICLGYGVIFYASGIRFGWAILSIVIIAAFHIVRDFPFFYHTIASGSGNQKRSRSLTLFFGSLYLAPLFVTLYRFPETALELLLTRFDSWIFAGLACLMIILAVVSLSFLARDRGLSSGVMIFLVGLSIMFCYIHLQPLTYVYGLVLWHFILWLIFISMKILSQHRALSVGYTFWHDWQRRPLQFILVTVSMHALIFLLPFLLLRLGFWSSFHELAYGSLLWGLYGYPFWSLAHIVFTSVPEWL